ncbi:MAG: tetratricopeptide repeat protein [Pseudomonadota bacterium]
MNVQKATPTRSTSSVGNGMQRLLGALKVSVLGGVAAAILTVDVSPIGERPSVAFSTATAQRNNDDDDGPRRPPAARRSQVLSQDIARQVQSAYEDLEAENYQAAKQKLDALLRREMKPFDRATVLQLRGSVLASLENYGAALRDFEAAIATGALPPETVQSLKFNLGQLYMAEEQYGRAIQVLEDWLRTAESPDSNAYYLLASAYVQTGNFSRAAPLAEKAVETAAEPAKGKYELLNYVFSETNQNSKRLPLLETMVSIWPDTKTFWRQLAGLYSERDRDRDAFAILELAYNAGVLEKCDEFVSLAQYYSFYDNPYRGGKLLEQEMNAGNCPRSRSNLELLSRLWLQAREHERALPPLRAAAERSDSGDLFLQLGQTYFSDENWSEAETFLVRALNKGVKERDRGNAWLLLGNARYNRDRREQALDAFENAVKFEGSRASAQGWLDFIASEIAAEEAAAAFEKRRQEELEERERRRQEEEERQRRLLGDYVDAAEEG